MRTLKYRFCLIAVLVIFSACSSGPGLSPRQGFIDVPGGKVWYRIAGSGSETPVILLHGGPGSGSDYLKPLEGLALDRPVIFYDQLGCGRSDRPEDSGLWHLERFVEELAAVRRALNLEEVHIYGHSWGTMLAVDYVLTKPAGVKSLILASPCLSVKRWEEDARRLIAELPLRIQRHIRHHQSEGTTDSKEYEQAVAEFLKRHVCRLNPWPAELLQAFDSSNQEIYRIMWGPSEFHPVGNLKNYERVSRLHEITVPVFFTAGRYDEATPEATAWYRSHVTDSSLRIFEHSSHLPMFEEPGIYLDSIGEFLQRIDKK